MCHTGGLLRRASMVVQSEANGLEARFWIVSGLSTIQEFTLAAFRKRAELAAAKSHANRNDLF
jgi:hypothetical protein